MTSPASSRSPRSRPCRAGSRCTTSSATRSRPLNLKTVSSNVFTDPEIATVGYTQADVDAGRIAANVVKLPLLRNPRAKMQGIRDGFVKLFCRPGTGIVVGGVVVAPKASELIHPISIAVDNNLTVEQIANAFTVYPSLSGSIAEVARQLHNRKTRRQGELTAYGRAERCATYSTCRSDLVQDFRSIWCKVLKADGRWRYCRFRVRCRTSPIDPGNGAGQRSGVAPRARPGRPDLRSDRAPRRTGAGGRRTAGPPARRCGAAGWLHPGVRLPAEIPSSDRGEDGHRRSRGRSRRRGRRHRGRRGHHHAGAGPTARPGARA